MSYVDLKIYGCLLISGHKIKVNLENEKAVDQPLIYTFLSLYTVRYSLSFSQLRVVESRSYALKPEKRPGIRSASLARQSETANGQWPLEAAD